MEFQSEEMKVEYRVLDELAKERLRVLNRLIALEAAISRNSLYYQVGEDGLVDLVVERC